MYHTSRQAPPVLARRSFTRRRANARAQLENVIGCDKIDAAQRKLICYLCGSRGGAPVQCAYGCCRAAYVLHP